MEIDLSLPGVSAPELRQCLLDLPVENVKHLETRHVQMRGKQKFNEG
jgi:hypothetical protein